MISQKRIKNYSVAEIFLPLVFFSGKQVFFAAFLIPIAAAITLLVLEILRSQPRHSLAAFYLFWLAALGGAVWITAELPPYWIWSVYLWIPDTAWAPSDRQRTKPFLHGFKKYGKMQALRLVWILSLGCIFAAFVLWGQNYFRGVLIWIHALVVLVLFEFLLSLRQGRKA